MKQTNTPTHRVGRPLITLGIALGALLLMGFACGGETKPAPSQYVGFWTGTDGSTVTIRSDGGADFDIKGNVSNSATNGSVVIDEAAKTLKLNGVFGGPSYTIDKAPDGSEMTLSGIVFKKGGVAAEAVMPDESELQSLALSTLGDFFGAVETGKFDSLHQKMATIFQDEYTPEKFKEAFKGFVEKKVYLKSDQLRGLKATFEPSPTFETVKGDKGLILTGFYPTTPAKTRFTFKYVKEAGTWKPYNLKVDIKSE